MRELETDPGPSSGSIFPDHVLQTRRENHRNRRLGPFKPRNSREAAILTRIRGATANPEWLPEGASPELDALREKQRKHVDQMLGQMRQVRDLTTKFSNEDDAYTRLLEEAFAGDGIEAEDQRTTEDRRDAELTEVLNRYRAAGALLVDVCDRYVETARRQLPELLAELRRQDTAADEAYREKLAEAERERAKLFHIQGMARWFKATARGGAFGRSEHPKTGPAPRSSFKRDPRVYEIEFFDEDRMGSIPKPVSKIRREADPTGKVQPLDQ